MSEATVCFCSYRRDADGCGRTSNSPQRFFCTCAVSKPDPFKMSTALSPSPRVPSGQAVSPACQRAWLVVPMLSRSQRHEGSILTVLQLPDECNSSDKYFFSYSCHLSFVPSCILIYSNFIFYFFANCCVELLHLP